MGIPSFIHVRLRRACVPGSWHTHLTGWIGLLFVGSLTCYLIVGPRVPAVETAVSLYGIPGEVVRLNPPTVTTDPAFYQHVGWYVTRGAVPYVDIWSINPPLTFVVAAFLSVVAGGNPSLQHALGVLVTFAAVAGAVLLTGRLAADITGNHAAAIAAGLVLLAPAEVYGLPPYGLRSQFFALPFGVLALVLAQRSRPVASGASAAVAAGFWQPGGVIALLVVGIAAQRHGWAGAARATAGGLAVAVAVVLPFLAVGAAGPMIAQTVLAPLLGQEPYTLLSRTYRLVLAMGYATVLLPAAVAGWSLSALKASDRWWIPVGGLGYGLQVYFVNFNGSLDAVLLLVFVALGVAVVVAALPTGRRRWVLAAVVLLVATGPIWHLAPTVPPRETVESRYERADPDANPALVAAEWYPPDLRVTYWQQRRPASCHVRLSHTELRWIAMTSAEFHDRRCGVWPG